MKIFIRLIIILLSFCAAPIVDALAVKKLNRMLDVTEQRNNKLSPRKQKLKAMLYAAQYGNKTANLEILMTGVCKEPVIGAGVAYSVAVPEFVGISHDEIAEFLARSFGEALEAKWQKLCETTLWPNKNRKAVLDELAKTKKYPQAFLSAVDQLGQEIKKTFVDNGFTFSNEQALFITKKNGMRLMVRSTGKEDSKESANAGGNETIANVEPTLAAVSKAMGEVVASYLGEKSLQQRLAVAKPENVKDIFDEPFVPVLLQEMVGEPLGGEKITRSDDIKKLPVSGVMFTTEAEAETPGLTQIQTTFGHNEGVVNSLVPVDTWYVGPHGIIYPIVRKKWQRLIPIEKTENFVKKSELIRKDNIWDDGKKSFAELSTLDYCQAQALKAVAQRIEAYYKMPMDVEFVLMPNRKTIYLVQARPIVIGNKKPSYVPDKSFDEVKKQNPENILSGVKVGVGDASVRCAGSSGILINDRLAGALDAYLAMGAVERKKIVCVVVKEMPAATSHEATTFRAENMPVIQFDNPGKINQLQGSIVIDVQRGILINTDKKLQEVEGWYEFPAPRQVSVGVLEQKNALTNIKNVLKELVTKEALQKLMFEKLKMPIGKLFDELRLWDKGNDQAECIKLGQSGLAIFYRLWSSLSGAKKSVDDVELFMRILHKLVKKESFGGSAERFLSLSSIDMQILEEGLLCLEEILRIAPKISNARDLRMLYPVHFLWALFNQKRNEQVVGAYSLGDLLGKMKQAGRVIARDNGQANSVPEVIFKMLADVSFSEKTTANWDAFVKDVMSMPDDKQEEFANMLVQLGSLGVLPLWLNVSFEAAVKKNNGKMAAVVTYLLEEFNNSSTFLDELREKSRTLEEFDISQFENPGLFEKLWKNFEARLEYFKGAEFLKVFKPVSKLDLETGQLDKSGIGLEQLVALNIMNKVVDKLDLAIKAMKGSVKYAKIEDKVKNFKTMVLADWELFENWIKLVPYGTFRDSISKVVGGPLDVQKYLERYQELKSKEFMGGGQLQPNKFFNVTTATIGSAAALNRTQPETLEDYFTLSHQNLLVTVSSLLRIAVDVDKIEIPPLLKELQNIFNNGIFVKGENPDPENFKVRLQGVSFGENMLSFTYTLPLCRHSAGLGLRYDKKLNKIYLDALFFGNDRAASWDCIFRYAGVCEILIGVKCLSRSSGRYEAEFTWEIIKETKIDQISGVLGAMGSWAFGADPLKTDFINDYWKNLLERFKDLDQANTHLLELAVDSFVNKFDVKKKEVNAFTGSVLDKLVAISQAQLINSKIYFIKAAPLGKQLVESDNYLALWKNILPSLKASIAFHGDEDFWEKFLFSGNEKIKKDVLLLFDIWVGQVFNDLNYIKGQQALRLVKRLLKSTKMDDFKQEIFKIALSSAKNAAKNESVFKSNEYFEFLTALFEKENGFRALIGEIKKDIISDPHSASCLSKVLVHWAQRLPNYKEEIFATDKLVQERCGK